MDVGAHVEHDPLLKARGRGAQRLQQTHLGRGKSTEAGLVPACRTRIWEGAEQECGLNESSGDLQA